MEAYRDENYVPSLMVKDENGNPMRVKCDADGNLFITNGGGTLSAPVTPNAVSDDNYVKVSLFEDENNLPEYVRATSDGQLYVNLIV